MRDIYDRIGIVLLTFGSVVFVWAGEIGYSIVVALWALIVLQMTHPQEVYIESAEKELGVTSK